jgi:hypothetical protein
MNRELLQKPFQPHQIKQRHGNYGQILDYVEGHAVIERLNQAFDGNWTYELVDHKILEENGEVLVLGKLVAEGITKMAFGSKRITRNTETKSIVSLGDDLKAASTDALKKAASLLGVGLYLYSDSNQTGRQEAISRTQEDRPHNREERIQSRRTGDNGNRLTNRQLAAIFSIGKSKGLQSKEIKEQALEMFNKNLNFLTKAEASTLIESLQAG